MELRHLKSFLVLAEELHFGRAAKRLHIAQPPLSIQIMQLEHELRVKLFERNNRKVTLTNAGLVFVREVRQILDNIEKSVMEVQRAESGEVGQLRLGVVSSALYTLLPRAMGRFRDCFPHVEVVVQELSSVDQIRALLADQLDVGILYHQNQQTQSSHAISLRPVLTSPMVLALPALHPLAHQKKMSLEDIIRYRLIIPSCTHEPLLHDTVITICRDHGLSPTMLQEANTFYAMLGMVASSFGIAIVPGFTRKLRQHGILFRDIGQKTQSISLMLATHVRQRPSAIVNRFLSCF
jgi:DNA-binding transcriptional LysR family regulator